MQTYWPHGGMGPSDQPPTSLFRHDLHILDTLSPNMHQKVCRPVTQPLPPASQELKRWHVSQLRETRVEIIWHFRKSNKMLLDRATSSTYWMTDDFFHSKPISCDLCDPPRAELYVAGKGIRFSRPSLSTLLNNSYFENYEVRPSALQLMSRVQYHPRQ